MGDLNQPQALQSYQDPNQLGQLPPVMTPIGGPPPPLPVYGPPLPPPAVVQPPPQPVITAPPRVGETTLERHGTTTVDSPGDQTVEGLFEREKQAKEKAIADAKEFARVAGGITKNVSSGPPSKMTAILASSNKEGQELAIEEAANLKHALRIRADAEMAQASAQAEAQQKMVQARTVRNDAMNKEMDDRINAIKPEDPEQFWVSRGPHARARAALAIANWGASNDMQAYWSKGAVGGGNANAVADVYESAIKENIAAQMRSQQFQRTIMKDREEMLGSREAAAKSLEMDGYRAMNADFDAQAAKAKGPEAQAKMAAINQAVLAKLTQAQLELQQIMAPHVAQVVDKNFVAANYPYLKQHPELLAIYAPKMAKEIGGVEKNTAEIGGVQAKAARDIATANGEGDSDKAAKHISDQMVKEKVPELKNVAGQLKSILAQGDDAPGMGRGAQMLFPLTEEGRANQQVFANARNMYIEKTMGKRGFSPGEQKMEQDVINDALKTPAGRAHFMRQFEEMVNSTELAIEGSSVAGTKKYEANKAELRGTKE